MSLTEVEITGSRSSRSIRFPLRRLTVVEGATWLEGLTPFAEFDD